MGSSPSKGKLFSKSGNSGSQKAPLADAPQVGVDSTPVEKPIQCLETPEKESEPSPPIEDHRVEESPSSPLVSTTTPAPDVEDVQDQDLDVMHQEPVNEVLQAVETKKTAKIKKKKSKRRSSAKQRSSIPRGKVDFSPQMVRAHQSAYAFLNPNISKYETLLGLLDQAAQTQLSLQPMMSALVLRFEEINQALDEMAEEGELMLKEHEEYMALPSGMVGPSKNLNSTNTRSSQPEPPPDLLQQLLQHSTEKMRLVGGSVQALGDTTLEEAAVYYSSLSKLLVEKMKSKQAVERRLTQVLARVEGAAMRKGHPEDSALHSEDSGIGGENESLTGSERHRHHRGSAGSGSCGSGINIRGAIDSLHNVSPSLVGHNENDEDDEEEDEEDGEDYEDDDGDRTTRKRSNSSPPDPSQSLLYMCENYMKDHQFSVKRPVTAGRATKNENSSVSGCLNVMMALQNSQRDVDRDMKKMTEVQGYKELALPLHSMYRAGLRRHSLSGSTERGRENQPHLAPHPPKRRSVRRLINTFSQGVDGRPGQNFANVPPHIRKPKKNGIVLTSDPGNGNEANGVVNGNNNNNGWPDGRDDLDVDNLPPPPPEVLMDNSFQRIEGMQGSERRSRDDSGRTLPMISQNTRVSQRLRASVQNVEVLPSRNSMKPRPVSILPAHPVRQDAVIGVREEDRQTETDLNTDMEKANCLYQQARKIIRLRNAAEPPDKRNVGEAGSRGPSPVQGRRGQRCEGNDFLEGETSPCSLPVTAPPVSRVRLPPSCPSVCHRYPSPPVARPQSRSGPSSRPGSPRTVTRAVDHVTEEIIPSVSFRDARSVFCVNEPQNIPGRSVLPRPWDETSGGRMLLRRTGNSTRTSSSEFSRDGSKPGQGQ